MLSVTAVRRLRCAVNAVEGSLALVPCLSFEGEPNDKAAPQQRVQTWATVQEIRNTSWQAGPAANGTLPLLDHGLPGIG